MGEVWGPQYVLMVAERLLDIEARLGKIEGRLNSLEGVPDSGPAPDEAYRLADLWRELQVEAKVWVRKTTPWPSLRHKWATAIDMLNRIDGLEWAAIERMIRWVVADQFWQRTAQSPIQLRQPSKSNPDIRKWQQVWQAAERQKKENTKSRHDAHSIIPTVEETRARAAEHKKSAEASPVSLKDIKAMKDALLKKVEV